MLLLRSEVELKCSVDISLFFDDSTEKSVQINNGNYVLIKHRYNGNKIINVGRVNKIDIQFKPTNNQMQIKSAFLIVDAATEFESTRYHIHTNDILNIRVVTEEMANEILDNWDKITFSDKTFTDGVDPLNPDAEPPEEPTEEDSKVIISMVCTDPNDNMKTIEIPAVIDKDALMLISGSISTPEESATAEIVRG